MEKEASKKDVTFAFTWNSASPLELRATSGTIPACRVEAITGKPERKVGKEDWGQGVCKGSGKGKGE